MDRDNEITESGRTGETDEAYEMSLIEEDIPEAEWGIAEGTDLIAGTETETEEVQNKNVVHTDLQVPTVKHTYNLCRRRNPWQDYTSRYGFQATIIHCALTELSMKRELKNLRKM